MSGKGAETKRKRPTDSYSELLSSVRKKYQKGTLNYLSAVLYSIDAIQDLRREKLTLSDYRALLEIRKEMTDFGGGASFMSGNVKDFFERHGFNIKPDDHGVSWYVTCKEPGGLSVRRKLSTFANERVREAKEEAK